MPIIITRPQEGTFAVFVAAFAPSPGAVSGIENVALVILEPKAQFKVRGWLPTASKIGFGTMIKEPRGGFGCKFETMLKDVAFAAGPIQLVFLAFAIVLSHIGRIHSQETPAPFVVPTDIECRKAEIISEGVRSAAEVYSPRQSAEAKLSTIVMSHGWGGIAASLRPDAIVFARAGFLVVSFDNRGWGKSDGRMILRGPKPDSVDGKLLAEVFEIREVVDPIDQTTDIMNAINWVVGEPKCDPERIGLWGSSYSGGHVVYVAVRDPRVKVFVSQVGAMDSRWTIASDEAKANTFDQGTKRARGKIGHGRQKVTNVR